jgi:hypothetical protein
MKEGPLYSNATPRTTTKGNHMIIKLARIGFEPAFRNESHWIRENILVVMEEAGANRYGRLLSGYCMSY